MLENAKKHSSLAIAIAWTVAFLLVGQLGIASETHQIAKLTTAFIGTDSSGNMQALQRYAGAAMDARDILEIVNAYTSKLPKELFVGL